MSFLEMCRVIQFAFFLSFVTSARSKWLEGAKFLCFGRFVETLHIHWSGVSQMTRQTFRDYAPTRIDTR